MITLDAITLPDNLVWTDEHVWEPYLQTTRYCFGGSLVVEEYFRSAGRPITLTGGRRWAWIDGTELAALRTLLDTVGSSLTLTLHDARVFTVIPRRERGGALIVRPLPQIIDSGVADPGPTTKYILEQVRLLEV